MKRAILKYTAVFSLISLFLFSGSLIASDPSKMNVLFIAIDDLKPVLNCYGESQILSPTIDKIAQQGVLFRRAYCQWPVCGATRASMLTGLTPDGNGVRNLSTQLRDVSPDVITMPQYFRENGYVTAAVGKVFDPRTIDDGHDIPSWTHPYNNPGNYTYPPEYGDFVKGQYRVTANTATERGPAGVGDDGYIDGQICIEALSKLDGFASTREPFFLAVGFKKPHIPFIAPEKYWDMYEREELSLSPFQSVAEGSPEYAYHTPEPMGYDDIPDIWTYSDIALGDSILHPGDQRKLLHGYYACVSYIDTQVDKLLNKLEEKGLADSTIIVIWGDHGYHLGDHNQWGKHTNFEQATRAPLIIYYPGNIPSVYEHPVEFLDIYPTLCELTNLKVSNVLQGKSLVDVMDGSGEARRVPAVSEYRSGGHSSYSFRTERYRFTLWMNKTSTRPDEVDWDPANIFQEELYDYMLDYHETENLAGRQEYAGIRDSLLNLAAEWWEEKYAYFLNPPNGIANQKEEFSEDIFYPNPASHMIWTYQTGRPQRVQIYSIDGKIVLDEKTFLSPLDISFLPEDTYIIRINDGINTSASKMIKMY